MAKVEWDNVTRRVPTREIIDSLATERKLSQIGIANATSVVHLVPAGKTLKIYGISIQFAMEAIAASIGYVAVRNATPTIEYYLYYMRFAAGQGDSLFLNFSPCLSVPAASDVVVVSNAATLFGSCSIFGYQD